MKYLRSFQLWTVAAICVGLFATRALADCNVQPGTVITKANSQQYKDCFSNGVQKFWEGSGYWKMPDDAEIHVGKPHIWMTTMSRVPLFRILAVRTRAPR